ncbi:(2,3-dihydroxybenzoyl)adenylate synthase [Marinomonas ostreistagni]|uniref:(2,3-dihydroxybenzoyl)adenylate synthase n=1 Tax=Marinomonas ostreistagni TaxID=359209 RepID=UPI00195031D6|nr:(2,3-dihydroxybenzoyl)adenylate synthase [Marinomonas ostreistagni]MBM6549490.1 (2,3-dihydroxybenzoyl)adenylate synthase [Marinomonas ostreistagni]
MSISFTPWPAEFAACYREKGYWIDRPLTELIEFGEPQHVALICGERQFTYDSLRQQSDNLAANLYQMGLRAGDTAVVQLPNVAEFYVAFFALLKIGVVPVNALFNHNERELESYTEQIQPRIIIASERHKLFRDDVFYQRLQSLAPALDHLVLLESDSWAQHNITSLAHTIATLQFHRFEPSQAHEVAFFQLSGGSTGTPKLIPRTHNDYYFSIRRSAEICELNSNTRFLCALPCAHNYPMSSPGAFGVFWAGGCVVMAPNPDALTCFELIEKHQVSMAALVPPAVALWVQAASRYQEQLKTLTLMQVGGAKLSETIARRIPEALGCQLQQVLGMAEGLVNYTRLDDDLETIMTTQGRPMCSLDEVKVVDSHGQPVANGIAGQLVTRGPYTIRGYFNAPEHNKKAFDQDGFYHSGDLVTLNDQGYLTVVGRDKDQINRGGEKIAAEEIENLLLTHEQIMHGALVAMPDALMGEKSCAFIVPFNKHHTLKGVTLRKYLRAQGVADYKIPDHFEFIDQLPLTPVGKPNKALLRAQISATLNLESMTEKSK